MVGINKNLLSQSLHRFRSLEAELFENKACGKISEAEYRSKFKRLELIRSQLTMLQGVIQNPAGTQDMDRRTIELPVLSDCSRMEQKIVHKSLVETSRTLKIMAEDSVKLLKWVHSSHSGKSNWFKLIVQLSWQRARIVWVTKQLDSVRQFRRVLEDFISRFTSPVDDKNSKADFVDTFREFESTTSRIADLRARLHRENSINQDQVNWLKQYEIKRKKENVEQSPPVPAEIFLAKNEFEKNLTSSSDLAKERLVIARKLVRSLDEKSDESTEEENKKLEEMVAKKFSKKQRIAKKQRSGL